MDKDRAKEEIQLVEKYRRVIEKERNRERWFEAIILGLSSYIGLFFAYVVQLSYNAFSNSVELSSYITANRLTEYRDMAYSFIRECYHFSDQNICIVILGSIVFVIFVVTLKFVKKPSNEYLHMLFRIAIAVSLFVWFAEPLVAILSSIESPNMAILIGWGKIPNSDVAAISQALVQLDRFRLFSRAFFFSFRTMSLATFVLLSCLSLQRLRDQKLRLWKRIVMRLLSTSPIIVLLLFWLFSPSMTIIFYGGGEVFLEGVGQVSLYVSRPFLTHLDSALYWILNILWLTSLLVEETLLSKTEKSIIRKIKRKLWPSFKKPRKTKQTADPN
jgi:hypothetical protein